MSSTVTERPTEINVSKNVYAAIFSTNGEHLMSGGEDGVRVWQMKKGCGERVATMKTKGGVCCLAVSADGRWVAAGTLEGDVFVWNVETREQVFSHKKDDRPVNGVDFSPDSTRLLAASSSHSLASAWDFATCQEILLLSRDTAARAAKYSPQGDRIATATWKSVQVYDSKDGGLLVDVKVKVTSFSNNGLLWFNNHLLVISDGKIKEFEASTGSAISEWSVPDGNGFSCIALPKHGKFIAYSTKRTVTFWDTSTHIQLSLIRHPQDICSITFSPDDRYLAIGGDDGKISIESLSHIDASTREQGRQDKHPSISGGHDDNPPDSIPEPHKLQSLSRIIAPDFQIDGAALDLWRQGRLTDAEVLLARSPNPTHHVLASRAVVRARLRRWDTALADAEKAIEIQPSVIGYIAKSIALVGKGERLKGYRACDIAFARFHSSHVTFLLLIKTIIVFMAGEHLDAIFRVDDLISTVAADSTYHVVQAYMYILLGDSQMQSNDYEGAVESFGHARTRMQRHTSQPPLIISLMSGWKFDHLCTMIRQRLCEALYAAGRTKEAVEYFHEMANEFGAKVKLHGEHLEWALDFGQRSSEKLARLGDMAANAQRYDEAISHYTFALSLDPHPPQSILMKRSKAFLETGSWKQALDDANQVIRLDPSLPWGYEMKHAALHKAGEYDNAVDIFETMLSKMAESPDPDVQQRGDRYISPSSTRATIRKVVQRTICHSPRVLINISTGCLLGRAEQASAFESLPIFKELVSSTTTRIDYVRIKREVRQYFRYVMLSHKWEDNEPLFQHVIHIAVYELDKSPTHDKLQTFCKIVRDSGFNWAWSDTCCIDKSDHFVLQESLVAMFRWYQNSAMVIVFLRGVHSSSQLGALVKSIWNTRAWTLQEYVAARVVHFYTEDWTLYLDLELPNHKESPEVISEMEQATGVSAEQLMGLRPGLTCVREKLRLASTRQTTLVEDAAYSLLGIFSVTGLPAIYGEGEGSIGRLLAHVLTGSGDVSVLAWTGESGGFNSCLPANITVFDGPATSHLPPPIPNLEMEKNLTAPNTSSFDLDVALRLYDRLNELPAPWFAASRMKLPGIAFHLPPLSRSGRVYRADTPAFGMVEITTRHDLSRFKSLYLLHPWLDSLLQQEPMHNSAFIGDDIGPPSPNTDDEPDDSSSTQLSSHPAPVDTVPVDKETRARRFVARLKQPFGALLVTPVATGRRAMDYRRVGADSLITVQFQEHVSLADILDNVCTLDIL